MGAAPFPGALSSATSTFPGQTWESPAPAAAPVFKRGAERSSGRLGGDTKVGSEETFVHHCGELEKAPSSPAAAGVRAGALQPVTPGQAASGLGRKDRGSLPSVSHVGARAEPVPPASQTALRYSWSGSLYHYCRTRVLPALSPPLPPQGRDVNNGEALEQPGRRLEFFCGSLS